MEFMSEDAIVVPVNALVYLFCIIYIVYEDGEG